MPSLAPVVVNTNWTLVQAGPFVGQVSSLTSNGVMIQVAGSLPTPSSLGVGLGSHSSIYIQPGENLYARAYKTPASVQLDSEIVQAVTLPLDLMTDAGGPNARIRVDNAQTGFFAGREFRVVRKITTPRTFRFTFPVPVILFEQLLSVSVGDVELYAWAASNVTPSGVWTTVPIFPKNGVNLSYTGQATVDTGGEVAPTNAELYRDYARVATSGATGQRFTVGGPQNSERYLAAGVYYVQLIGTGEAAYSAMWEERP